MNNHPKHACDYCWEYPIEDFIVTSPISQISVCGKCITEINGTVGKYHRGKVHLEVVPFRGNNKP